MSPALRIAIGIATVGRPQLMEVVLAELRRQSRPPDLIAVCAPTPADVGDVALAAGIEVDVIVGPRGLTRQRNAILNRAREFDVIVFFDDDFLPERSYLHVVEQVFAKYSDVVMATGTVVADGIVGPGLTVDEAHRRLASIDPIDGRPDEMRDVAGGYGCNMAVRVEAVNSARCRFDDNLPLYGWLEDVDFSGQIAPFGRIVKLAAAQGVHLGIKQGRQSGVRLGYSQIANPIYLSRKGTCSWSRAMRLMSRNIAANCLRSVKPEPYVDRLGRAAGNLRALRDLLAGRLAPERILDL
jgi:GT2 family glycosyltransferase